MPLETATLIWIALPFLIGFSIYLLPRLDRSLALVMALLSLAYSLPLLGRDSALSWELLDSFGVTLQVDSLSGYFILTHALVTAAVLLYCWSSHKGAFFYSQVMILHGSVNAVFICADFISLYVALEVIGVASFLLITHGRSDRSIWVGLRYLFVSNTSMLFYLMGAILSYQASQTFAFAGMSQAPVEAIALMVLGLMTKGGIFVSGLWLPVTHAEAETPVSALLSGIVIKAGIFPLLRCAMIYPELGPTLRLLGIGTALLGVAYAMFEKDTKRMLAWSTISQVGFMLVAPAAAGGYALSHGLAKVSLFLTAGNLPSRDFQVLRQQPLPRSLWGALAIAALSVSGMPLLVGFGAKALVLNQLSGVPLLLMNLSAVGTAIVCAKFIFLPFSMQGDGPKPALAPGLRAALPLSLGGLWLASGLHGEVYNPTNLFKALAIIGLGWLIYSVGFRQLTVKLPQVMEQFDNLIGTMILILVGLLGLFIGVMPAGGLA